MNPVLSWLAPALALSLSWPAVAQPRADAAALERSAPPPRYRSAYADYTPWQDLRPGDWRQLNDALRPATGSASGQSGHAGHGGRSAAPASAASAPAPAEPAHAHHPMHPMRGGRP